MAEGTLAVTLDHGPSALVGFGLGRPEIGVPRLEEHPLAELVRAGAVVALNSDDPPMFATSLNQEYEVAAHSCSTWMPAAWPSWRGPVRCSFLDAEGQRRLLGEIDAYATSTGPAAG